MTDCVGNLPSLFFRDSEGKVSETLKGRFRRSRVEGVCVSCIFGVEQLPLQ